MAVDANPAARDAFGLRGSAEDEALFGAVKLYDFNGDRELDLLFYGEAASYVLLGPVELDNVTDVRDEADFIIDADVGMPAVRMGDVSGDGLADLLITYPDGLINGYVISGTALWRDEDADGNKDFASPGDLKAAIWADTSDRAAVAQEFLDAEIAETVQLGQNVRGVVAEDGRPLIDVTPGSGIVAVHVNGG